MCLLWMRYVVTLRNRNGVHCSLRMQGNCANWAVSICFVEMLNVGVEPVLIAKNTRARMVVDIVKTGSKFMISPYKKKARNRGGNLTLAFVPRPSDESNEPLLWNYSKWSYHKWTAFVKGVRPMVPVADTLKIEIGGFTSRQKLISCKLESCGELLPGK